MDLRAEHDESATEAGRFRLPGGGHVDRHRLLKFRWNGRTMTAYSGDTLASALLAHGERIVGRSMKLHRPRGILSAGAEEANALVTLSSGAHLEPTARATQVQILDGLEARPQNCWPSVRFDVARVLDFCAPLWAAGFYNKTFIWPSWRLYEPVIRRTAGLGPALTQPDPDHYDSMNASCDLLIAGGGPAGLVAALTAGRAGLRVILAEQDLELGGSLRWQPCEIDNLNGAEWATMVALELQALPNVQVLTATTVFGLYDHGTAGLVERVCDKLPSGPIAQRYWRVRARETLVAAGSIEQPWIFERNDLPGIMLAGAIHQYVARYAVAAGRRIAFVTNNDTAYLAALHLARAGVNVPVIVDSRPQPPTGLAAALKELSVEIRLCAVVQSAHGGSALSGIRLAPAAGGGGAIGEIKCDALGMSAGWAPAVHLFAHARGRLRFDQKRQCFLPIAQSAPVAVAGTLAGATTISDVLESGWRAAVSICSRLKVPAPSLSVPHATTEFDVDSTVDSNRYSPYGRDHRKWVDFQHDVTVADLRLALREGYDSIEHIKRYTTTGMSVDQGKTSNLNALLLVARLKNCSPDEVGTTTSRPPYMPITLGTLAARQLGRFYTPRRQLPAHAEHLAAGAHFQEIGGWMRPECYPCGRESRQEAIRREALAVRTSAGIFDASPLGKIEVAGSDAATFIDRFYVNNMASLEIGRVRYGLMLNENGVIIDDGTVARFGDTHYLLTTTSGGAGRIADWLERWRQCEWPHLEVLIAPVTTQWATIVLAGPQARAILAKLPTDIRLDAASFPHMHLRIGTLAGVTTRLYRVSFSGEIGYEINVPARYGAALWRALLAAGRDYGITPYGVGAVQILRLEKGFLHVGADTDGTTSPADVGWGEIAMKKKVDFLGRRSLTRPDNIRDDRLQLVGLTCSAPHGLVPGAHLRLAGTSQGSDGWVTSGAMSPSLGRSIALAMLKGGRRRMGETVTVHDLGRKFSAEVQATPFYDPKNERTHA